MTKRLSEWSERFYDRMMYILLYMGDVVQLTSQVFTRLWKRPFPGNQLVEQLEIVGVESVWITSLVALFSGMVITVQLLVNMERFGAKILTANSVTQAFFRELGPVLISLIVGGRVGAGMTAELGAMSVAEQIDAMRSMGADPVRKLVIPRVVACVIMVPLLVNFGNLIGVFGATLIGWTHGGIQPQTFLAAGFGSLRLEDFASGFIKPVFFGFFTALIACYQGLQVRGGTEQVGEATTETVVITASVTLIVDFILTNLLLGLGL